MWIERLDVLGFRRLRGPIALSPRLTIVHGENEAGKTTLQDMLLRTLYGFTRAERRRAAGASDLDRSAPWVGGAYGVVATLRDAPLGIERVEWDFRDHVVRAFDALGADLSHHVRLKGQDVRLGEALLGLSIEDFRAVCCLGQEDVVAVARTGSLEVALAEAVASVGDDTSVDTAVGRLEATLGRLGLRKDTLKPTATGPHAALLDRCQALADRLARAEAAREELAGLAARRDLVRAERDAAAAEVVVLERAALVDEASVLAQRLDRVRELEAQVAAAGAVELDQGPGSLAAARDARAALDRAADRLVDAERRAGAAAAEAEGLAVQARAASAGVDELAAYAEVDRAARERVLAGRAALEEVRGERIELPEPPVPDPDLAAYRAARARLVALERAAAPAPTGLLALLVAILTFGLRPLLARRRAAAARAELAGLLAVYGGTSVAELDARVAAEEEARLAALARRAAALDRRTEQDRRAHELVVALTAALDDAGWPAAGAALERAADYLLACDRADERDVRVARLAGLERALEQAAEPTRWRDRIAEDVAGARAQLLAAVAAAGGAAGDEAEARASLARLEAVAVAAEAAARRAGEARAALATALDGEAPAALARRAADAARRLAAHREAHPDVAGGRRHDPVARAAAARRLSEAREALAALDGQVEAREQAAEDVVELGEALAGAAARAQRVEEAGAAIALARELLLAAAEERKREFAPALAGALARTLPRVTAGRYAEARVDGELRVRLVAPETGQLVEADVLSRGTRDQIYLVQRLEIARLLAGSRTSVPLLLDDPFARTDRLRQRGALEVLREVAEQRQVVLSTDDEGIVELAREVVEDVVVIELTSPADALLEPLRLV